MNYEITVKRKVFPDPEFCAGLIDKEYECCRFLAFNEECVFFGKGDGVTNLKQKTSSAGYHSAVKCPECKAACQKNESKDEP